MTSARETRNELVGLGRRLREAIPGVYAGYTQLQFSGTAGLAPTGGGLPGSQTTVDLESDLGLDEPIGSFFTHDLIQAC